MDGRGRDGRAKGEGDNDKGDTSQINKAVCSGCELHESRVAP